MTHRQRYQRQSDLFVPNTPLVPMTASERAKLLPLVSALLSEILGVVAVTVRHPTDEPARFMDVAADLWGPTRITDQKLKGCVTLVQRPPFTTARNEEFAPCRMFGPKLICGPLKMSR